MLGVISISHQSTPPNTCAALMTCKSHSARWDIASLKQDMQTWMMIYLVDDLLSRSIREEGVCAEG